MTPKPVDATVKPFARPFSAPARPEVTGGRRIGVLLSHGFTGSPASMVPWGRALAERGYGVEVPRLPGHGTSWQEMNTTGWDDWYGEVSRTFARLRAENDVVVVGGLSMGGALTLRLTEEHDAEIAGLILVNPAVASKRKDALLLPVVKHLLPSFPGIGSDVKKPGVVEDAYDRTPLKAAHSMFSAWPAVVRDLPRVTVPVLYLRSTEDHVVDELSERHIRGGLSSTDVTFVPLADSYHVATIDNDAELIVEASAEFIARVTSPVPGTGVPA